MNFAKILPLFAVAIGAPAEARVTIFKFSGVVQTEFFNGDEATGLGLLPIQRGDTISGYFDFDDTIVGQIRSGRDVSAFFTNPTRQSQIQFSRNGASILTIRLRPIIFGNGNRADQSQLNLTDGDLRLRRDSLSFSIQGGDTTSGSVLEFIPDIPEINYSSFGIVFREQCATGSVSSGNCISNSPLFDFFDGSNPQVDFLKAFNTNGERFISFDFNYRNGDFGEIAASLDTLSTVPEPTMWAMLIFGFAFIGCTVRRQRNSLTVEQVGDVI